jgi:hypothetical protein
VRGPVTTGPGTSLPPAALLALFLRRRVLLRQPVDAYLVVAQSQWTAARPNSSASAVLVQPWRITRCSLRRARFHFAYILLLDTLLLSMGTAVFQGLGKASSAVAGVYMPLSHTIRSTRAR